MQEVPYDSALFPGADDRLRWDDIVSRSLHDADLRVKGGSVAPTLDRASFRMELTQYDFARPRPLGGVLNWIIAQMEKGIVHPTNPRYFGLFNPAPAFPAICADRIASVFNPQLASATTSPAAVDIEGHTIRAVGARMGIDPAIGHFTSGGSEANYTALLCALTRADRGFAATGARVFSGPPVFYVSSDSHLAWIKIAHQSGIGRSAVRQIPTDGGGRLDAEYLARTLAQDRADGCVPVMIAATAGTTCAGAIDPLDICADRAREAGVWYHVDAAWGGALVASERYRHLLKGIERADSVTLDAHKWFATTMGCGMFITPHADALNVTFGVTANFMPLSQQPARDPYVTTAQWSRRFLGLRLFMALAAAGWQGYARHVERAVALSRLLKEILQSRGWKIVNDPALAVLCVEPPAGSLDVRTIVDHVVSSGQAWISTAMFEGRDVIRACVTHGETSENDIVTLAEALDAAALPAETPQAVA